MYHEAARMVEAAGLKPVRSLVGSYLTSLDMAGAPITLSLLDDSATKLWDASVHTPALRWGAVTFGTSPNLGMPIGRKEGIEMPTQTSLASDEER
jgi:Dak1 domain-containing protein